MSKPGSLNAKLPPFLIFHNLLEPMLGQPFISESI
jgi:hypothetical protein